jgi:hypothetical protein
MSETAIHLVDRVLPAEPIRQWVLSFPFQLRLLLAIRPKIMAVALRIAHECITGHLRKKTGLAKSQAQTGAVTLIQRFGGSINLNVHFHQLFIDGAYEIEGESAEFHLAAPPTREEIAAVLAKIIRRLARHLERRGIIIKDEELQIDLDDDDSFAKLQAGAVSYRFALGPNKGKKALTLRTVPEQDHRSENGLVANEAGFSLHAGVAIAGGEREKLEKICRYVARPPIALERLRFNDRGEVVYALKKPYSDGTTHIKMQPLELMEKLAALVPRPRVHLTRFHGVLAPHSKHRRLVVPTAPPPPAEPSAEEGAAANQSSPGNPPAAAEPPSPARISWARLLKRVFNVDVEACNVCGGKTKIIAAIEDPPVIRKILGHLGLPIRPPPIRPAARGPPSGSAFDQEFSQATSFEFE